MAATLTVDLNARIAQFETEMKKATGSLDKFGQRGDKVAAGFKASFAGLAAGLSVGAIASFAKSGIDAADALKDMSDRTGVAVKDLAGIKLAAEQSGTSLEDTAKAISKLSLSVGQAQGGNVAMAAALKNLGVTAGEPIERLAQLADAVQKNGTSTKTLADLQKVLGKSYADQIPLLLAGGQAFRDSAKSSETFADAMSRLAPDADKFNDSLAKLKINTAGFAGTLLADAVPAVNTFIDRIGRLAAAVKSVGIIKSLSLTGTLSEDLPKVNADIAKLQEKIANSPKIAGKSFFDVDKLKAELSDLKKYQSALKAESLSGAMAIAEAQYKALPKGSAAAINMPADKVKSSASSKSDPAGDFVKKLRDEAATLGLSGEALQRYEAAKLKLTGTNAILADGFIRQISAFKEQQTAAEANNKAFDEFSESQDKVDSALESSIKSLREWLEEQKFEATLIGMTNAERETAIQLREAEAAGIDTQTESFKQLAAQIQAASGDSRLVSLISDTDIVKTREFLSDVDLITNAFFDGKIGAEQMSQGIDKITGSTEKASEKMDSFAKTAAENIQSSFADFFFDPFDKGMDGLLKGFADTVKRMAAEAASAQLTRGLFGDLVSGGSGSGVFGEALKYVGTLFGFADGGIAAYGKPVAMPRFAHGGVSNTAAIFGEAGPEAAVPLPDGRSIPVDLRGGGGGAPTIYQTITVDARGADSGVDAKIRQAVTEGARRGYAMVINDLSRGGNVARMVGTAG